MPSRTAISIGLYSNVIRSITGEVVSVPQSSQNDKWSVVSSFKLRERIEPHT